ncbi:MAG: hypothetical protein Q8O88_01625 [bacterium]|nr:hypothetical protein [bacterium]
MRKSKPILGGKGEDMKNREPLWEPLLGIVFLVLIAIAFGWRITSTTQKQTEQANRETVGKQFIVKGENSNNLKIVIVVDKATGNNDLFGTNKRASVSGVIYVESFNKKLISGDLCNTDGSMLGGCSERTIVLHWNDGSTQKVEGLYLEIPGWNYVSVSPIGIEPMENLP